MPLLLSCREIKKAYGETNILNSINFDIAVGEKIGLVGLNGAGKTTLVNIIAGGLEADSGKLYWHKKSVNIGYLRQESAYVEKVMEIGNMQDYLFTSNTLGLKKVREWDDTKLKHLSGGEKTKLSLSQIWSMNPDFLVLDEPTNHLDYMGVQWLIQELRKYKGTVLLISHDRYFLDECVNRIVEIENHSLQEYNGNYSYYKEEKKRRYESQLKQYLQQEEMKNKIKEQINNLKQWSEKAHRQSAAKAIDSGRKMGGKEFLRAKAKKMDIQVKSRIKRLEKIEIEGVEKPKEETRIEFKLKSAVLKGNRVIEAGDITKAYGEKILFRDSSFYIQKGEKVGIFGENGCGKTTLLKLLLGKEEPNQGDIFFSSSIRLGYLSQDISHLDFNKVVLDCFDIATREQRLNVHNLLFRMGFLEANLHQLIGSLSLGELTRLRIAQLIVKECDLLLLDEPLNHLDLNSREKLEEVLSDYNGTILLISHDRYMMERICNKLLVFENQRVQRIEYGLREYLEHMSIDKKASKKEKKEEMLLIDNELSVILGELSRHVQGTDEYIRLDTRFKELVAVKKEVENNVNK